MKESKRETDRQRERRKVAGTEKDEKERLVSTAGFSAAGTVYLRINEMMHLFILITQLNAAVLLLHCTATVT